MAQPRWTLTDYLFLAINPTLIGLMVLSLAWSLVLAVYVGDQRERLMFVCAMFAMGSVACCRLILTEGAAYAAGLLAVFAVVMGIGVAALVQFDPPLTVIGVPLAWALLGLIWYAAYLITTDATVVDDEQDATGSGLLEPERHLPPDEAASATGSGPTDASTPSRSDTPSARPASAQRIASEPEPAVASPGVGDDGLTEAERAIMDRYRRRSVNRPVSDRDDRPVTDDPVPELARTLLGRLAPRRNRPKRRLRPPGFFLVRFGLASLILLGFLQALIPASNPQGRRMMMVFLLVHVGCGLALLMSTSLLNLRRYLRQRRMPMSEEMTGRWIGSGAVTLVLFLILGLLIPLPGTVWDVPIRLATTKRTDTSQFAVGTAGTQTGEGANSTRPTDDPSAPATRPGDGDAGGDSSGQSGSGQSGSGQSGSGSSASKQNRSGAGQSSGSGGSSGSNDSSGSRQNQNQNRTESGPSSSPESPNRDSSSQSADSQSSNGQPSNSQTSGDQTSGDQSSASQASGSQASDSQSPGDRSSSDPQASGSPSSPSSSSSGESRSSPGESESSDTASSGSASSETESPDRSDNRSTAGSSSNAASDSAEQQAGRDGSETGEAAGGSADNRSSASEMLASVSETMSALGAFLAWALRIGLGLAIVGGVAWLAWTQRAAIADAWRAFRAELAAWWAWLMGERSGPRDMGPTDEGPIATPPRPFAAFANPFATGDATRQPPLTTIRHTYAALEAWAREADLPRRDDQTPHEFAVMLGQRFPGLTEPAMTLAHLADQALYSPAGVRADDVEQLRPLWTRMAGPRT